MKAINNNQSKGNKFVALWSYFSTYEKIWMLVFFVAAIVLAILVPEETTQGINGTVLTIIYLFLTVFGLLCELLTSKQSKWSFFIYIFVEIVQITMFVLLAERFASIAVSLFFWLPAHIITFINWNKHTDKIEKNKTVVRSLKPWHSCLMILGCVVGTAGFGYLIARFSPDSEIYSSDTVKVLVSYFDACIAMLSICDGILLFFRCKEAYILWFIYIPLETACFIMTGQWILLVLEAGYLSNTIYGFIKWSNYEKNHVYEKGEKSSIL